jgi:hypothetical protein
MISWIVLAVIATSGDPAAPGRGRSGALSADFIAKSSANFGQKHLSFAASCHGALLFGHDLDRKAVSAFRQRSLRAGIMP